MTETLVEEIQTYWQVPIICHFFHRFGPHLHSYPFYFQDLEAALINPDHFWNPGNGRLIDEIVFTLVRWYYDKDFPSDFTTAFRNMITTEMVEIDKEENPLVEIIEDEKTGQKVEQWKEINDLPIPKKVNLLEKMVAYVIASRPSFIHKYKSKYLRVKPIGQDSEGFTYWYFHGNRLYRQRSRVLKVAVERLDSIHVSKKSAISTKESRSLGSRKTSNKSKKKSIEISKVEMEMPGTEEITKQKSRPVKSPSTETSKGFDSLSLAAKKELWTVICETPREWEDLIKVLDKRKKQIDKDLADELFRLLPSIREAYDEKELAIPKREKIRTLRQRRHEISEIRHKAMLTEHLALKTETRLRSQVTGINYQERNSESSSDENQAPNSDAESIVSEGGSKANTDAKAKKRSKHPARIKRKKRSPKIPQTYHEKAILRKVLNEKKLKNEDPTGMDPTITNLKISLIAQSQS